MGSLSGQEWPEFMSGVDGNCGMWVFSQHKCHKYKKKDYFAVGCHIWKMRELAKRGIYGHQLYDLMTLLIMESILMDQ